MRPRSPSEGESTGAPLSGTTTNVDTGEAEESVTTGPTVDADTVTTELEEGVVLKYTLEIPTGTDQFDRLKSSYINNVKTNATLPCSLTICVQLRNMLN